MRKLLYVLTLFIGSSLQFVSAQIGMQDNQWFELDPPNKFTDVYETKSVAVNILDNGNIYMAYVHYNDQELKVAKLNKLQNQWDIVASYTIDQGVGFGINDMISYTNGTDLFYAIRRYGSMGGFLSLMEFDENEVLSVIMENQPTSFYDTYGFDMTVDFTNEIVYFTALDLGFNGIAAACYLINGNYAEIATISNSNDSPIIAVNGLTNTLFWATRNTNNQVIVRTSALQTDYTNINFTLLGGTGEVNTSLFTGPIYTSYPIQFVEKNGGDPDLVFSINSESAYDGLYRVNIGTLNTDVIVDSYTPGIEVPFSFMMKSAGRGDNTYYYGLHNWQQPASAIEIFSNGGDIIVAEDNNQYTLHPDGVDAMQFHASSFDNRLVSYYRQYGPSPETPGIFTITNRAPSVQSISEVPQGCFGTSSSSVFVDEILFNDPEGDEVAIVSGSVQTSGNGFADAMQDANGNWQLYGNFDQPGVVQITFSYTDGFDTLNHQFTYDPGNSPSLDFTQGEFVFCANDLPVQSSDLLNEPATGQFLLDFEVIPENEDVVTMSDLQNSGFLFGDTIILTFETVDEYGCGYSYDADLIIFEVPEVSMTVQPSSCGNNDGSAIATVTGANGSYSEYWSTGNQNTNSISDLPPGTYYYNIEDAQGCKAVGQANIEASGLSVGSAITPLSCHNGSDAAIELNLSGFSNPSILWSTGHSSNAISDLNAGNYEVTVWDDPNCQITETFTITNPAQFTVDFNVDLPSSCSSSDGQITAFSENNASGNVSYVWTGGSTGSSLTGVTNGVYTVTANDGSCTFEESFALNSSFGPSALASIINTECNNNNGAIVLNVAAYPNEQITGFEWSNSATSQNISGLDAGIYSLEIIQSDGCVSFFEYEVKTKRPAMQEICIVSVDSTTNTNLVIWEKPETNTIDYYNIYRETSVAGEFKIVGDVDYEEMSVFNDVVASPAVRSWRYRITAVNHCGVESHLSPIHKTIHLTTQEMTGGFVGVYWDNYEGVEFTEYDCYRYTEDNGWELLLAGIPYLALPYYLDEPPSTQDLDYMIEIDPGYECIADFGRAQDYNSTRSNRRKNSFAPGDGTGDPNNDLENFKNPNFGVDIFPNPSNGLFNLNLLVLKPNTQVTAEITDVTGRTIQLISVNEGMNSIDLSKQAAGSYIIKVSDGDFLQSFKLIKK